ncbi:hypothetical protein Y032_0068g214 [Ancylostoma ceylanicum]|uniref:Uncharacterized protein n=1 Tax=Ancylostoma ceylanicum TaxID=53326 RepID=A0A016TYS9_9BILA|nr:hypothetical protein Y032_0068g214 [Ancylostoma ceylanicum]
MSAVPVSVVDAVANRQAEEAVNNSEPPLQAVKPPTNKAAVKKPDAIDEAPNHLAQRPSVRLPERADREPVAEEQIQHNPRVSGDEEESEPPYDDDDRDEGLWLSSMVPHSYIATVAMESVNPSTTSTPSTVHHPSTVDHL